jgi:hypothetical protein
MKKLLLLFGGIAGFSAMYAQTLSPEVIASGGTSLSNSSGGMEFTIGEVATASLSASGDALTQGFNQPNIVIVGVENFIDVYTITMYPNPSNDFINLETNSKDELKATVFTAHGQFIFASEVFTSKIALDVREMANGPYMIRVTRPTGEPVKNFSVIKMSTF